MKTLLQAGAARVALVALIAVALGLSACKTPVGVRETGFKPVYAQLTEDVLDRDFLSRSSRMILEYFGLAKLYRDSPAEAVEELMAIARVEGLRGIHVGIAEMHYDIGLDTGDRSRFLAAAIHAYLYLFDDGFSDVQNPYGRVFGLACDLYNRGLARALRRPTGEIYIEDAELETPSGKVVIRGTRPGFPWSAEDFSTFFPADAYEIRGLRERVRYPGVGVPLIAVSSGEGAAALSAAHVGREIKLPATAFLRLNGGADELAAGELTADLELYLGTDVPTVEIGERRVPLAVDITAPLAFMLEETGLWSFGIRGFREGRSDDYETSVFMLQPYEPDKIPLVLIHGTASSPAAWAQTINGLEADPRITKRYQVWLALYNTGNPIAYSALLLRDKLRELVRDLDPEGDDAALSRMVLVGHSQGGLVSRLLVSSSGMEVWRGITDLPFEEYPEGESKDILERALFFDPLPFVERVVFIATPQRGSYVAGGWIGRLARRLISLPVILADMAKLGLTNQKIPPELRKVNTSVENMRPGSTFVKLLELMPISDRVTVNSIIAVKPGPGPIEEGDDGVVEYRSAHLDQAESECVVRRSHSCQGATETISELRRILFHHIGLDRAAAGRAGQRLPSR